MIIQSGDLRFVLEGGSRWTFVLENVRPDTPDTRVPDTRISVFRREVDGPPTASFTVDANEDDGSVTVTDTSTDAVGVASIAIDWGDGTVDSGLTPGGTYMHTYATSGTYTIELTATDTSGQADTASQSVSVTVVWTPTELGTELVAWRGVDEESTLTLRTDAGTDFVERLADRSGNGYDLAQGTATSQPVYDGTTVTFDGADDTLTEGAPVGVYNLYLVARTTDLAFLYPQSVSENANFGIVAEDGSTNTTLSQNYGSPTLIVDSVDPAPSTRDDVHTALADGLFHIVSHENADTSTWAGVQYGIYTALGGGFDYAGEFSAFLLTETTISAADVERMEGYLAYTFDVQDRLPGGHPYKSNPPTI